MVILPIFPRKPLSWILNQAKILLGEELQLKFLRLCWVSETERDERHAKETWTQRLITNFQSMNHMFPCFVDGKQEKKGEDSEQWSEAKEKQIYNSHLRHGQRGAAAVALQISIGHKWLYTSRFDGDVSKSVCHMFFLPRVMCLLTSSLCLRLIVFQ